MDNIEPILTSFDSEPSQGHEPKIKKNKFSNDALLIAVATIVGALLVCLTLLWINGSLPSIFSFKSDDVANSKNLIDDDAVLGNKNAKLAIVEFSDFQCPFCRKFWEETLPQIKKEYIDTGKVKFVYRDFPLSFHAAAQASAEATECAAEQNKYWEMHDKLFSEQAKKGTGTIQYTVADIKNWAKQIGLDESKFNTCLDSGKNKSEVDKDAQDGAKLGMTGTPAFFIGTQAIAGAYPFSEFKKVIDEELAK